MEGALANWPAIVGAVIAILVAIAGAATAYVVLTIGNKIGAHEIKMTNAMTKQKDEILDHIDEKFALKEMMVEKFASLETNMNYKFGAIESRIDSLERSRG